MAALKFAKQKQNTVLPVLLYIFPGPAFDICNRYINMHYISLQFLNTHAHGQPIISIHYIFTHLRQTDFC